MGLPVHGHLAPAANAFGNLAPVAPPGGECKLYSVYGGTKMEISGGKKLDPQAIQQLFNDMDAYIKTINPNATNIRLNLTTLVVKYDDQAGQRQYVDCAAPPTPLNANVLDQIEKIRREIKKILVEANFCRGLNDTALRQTADRASFVVPTEGWKQAMAKTPAAFIQGGSANQMMRILGNNLAARQEGLANVIAMEIFIKKLEEKVAARKAQLKQAIKHPNFAQRPLDDQRKDKTKLRQLEALENELKELDRVPLYCAAGIWANTNAAAATQADRLDKAGKVRQLAESTLSSTTQAGEDPRTGPWGKVKQWVGWGKDAANESLTASHWIRDYAADAGSIVLTEKMDLILQNNGNETAGRPSLVDVVASHFLHSTHPNFNSQTLIDSLNRQFDASTTNELVLDFRQAGLDTAPLRAQALATVGNMIAQNPSAALERFRKDASLKPFVG